jgi:hypothetical protein
MARQKKGQSLTRQSAIQSIQSLVSQYNNSFNSSVVYAELSDDGESITKIGHTTNFKTRIEYYEDSVSFTKVLTPAQDTKLIELFESMMAVISEHGPSGVKDMAKFILDHAYRGLKRQFILHLVEIALQQRAIREHILPFHVRLKGLPT